MTRFLIDRVLLIDDQSTNGDQLRVRCYPDEYVDFPVQTPSRNNSNISPREIATFCRPESRHHAEDEHESTGKQKVGSGNVIIPRRRASHSGTSNPSSFIFTLTDKDACAVSIGICLDVRLVRNGSKSLITMCLVTTKGFITTLRRCLNCVQKWIENSAKCGSYRKSEKCGSKPLWDELMSDSCHSEWSEAKIRVHWLFRQLLQIHCPCPEKTNVHLRIAGQDIEFALPDSTRLPLVDIPLHLLLELIGTEIWIKIYQLLMLEQKVLVVSVDVNALTMSVIAMVSLLYPLEYMFPIIPLLPTSLSGAEQLLFAPTPFVIGVTRSMLHSSCFRMPSDVWVLDLDNNTLSGPQHPVDLPALPVLMSNSLKSHLDKVMQKLVGRQPNGSLCKTLDADEIDVSLRVIMVLFLNLPGMLENIQEHTRILRLYPRPVVAFHQVSFKNSRRIKSAFIDRLAHTQAIEYFTEWLTCPTDMAYLRIQTGISDARIVGDKGKWFASQLVKLTYDLDKDMCKDSEACDSSTMDNLKFDVSEIQLSDSTMSDDEGKTEVAEKSRTELLLEDPTECEQPSLKTKEKTIASWLNEFVGGNVSPRPSPTMGVNDTRFQLLLMATDVAEAGRHIGWMKMKKLNDLMKTEACRNFLLSRLNGNFNKRYHSNEYQVEDVEISVDSFECRLKLIISVIQGLAHTYAYIMASNGHFAAGGIGSAFQLLEICYTHYCWYSPRTALIDTSGARSPHIGRPVKVKKWKCYLWEEISRSETRNAAWDDANFWEMVFLDAVSQERDTLGWDQSPAESITRYNMLQTLDQKRIELEEDSLLSRMLSNMVSYMVMLKVKPIEISGKIRRILGRCHIGLAHSQNVNDLIDRLPDLRHTDRLPIQPLNSRLAQVKTYLVMSDFFSQKDQMTLVELHADYLLLRAVDSEAQGRIWFESVVSVSFCSKTNMCCLWRQHIEKTVFCKFKSPKAKEIYEMVIAKSKNLDDNYTDPNGMDVKFPISHGNKSGTIEIKPTGHVILDIDDEQEIIGIQRVRKLSKMQENLFVLEEFDPETNRLKKRTYNSPQARQICLKFIAICSFLSSQLQTTSTVQL